MHRALISWTLAAASLLPGLALASRGDDDRRDHGREELTVQLGPRPFFLVNDMVEAR